MTLAYPEIQSVKNPQVQKARELSARKGREEHRAFLCDGEHMVAEAIAVCPEAVQAVFVEKEKLERFAGLLDTLLAKRKAAGEKAVSAPPMPDIYAVAEPVLSSLSQVKTHQGIAAVVKLPAPVTDMATLGQKLILLQNVQDPGNVGTILRTLDAAGFDGCLLTDGCADPFAPKTLRASMGSVFRVPMVFLNREASSLPEALSTLKARGYALLAAELHGEPFYERAPLPEKLCLMIGNEGAGLTTEACHAATHRFRLPMRGGAESLNAAMAAAVMMYDLINR